MVLHDASLAAPLRLIWAGLDLHRPPFAPPPYSVESAASPSAPQTACFTTSKSDGASLYICSQEKFLPCIEHSTAVRTLSACSAIPLRTFHYNLLVIPEGSRRPPCACWLLVCEKAEVAEEW